MYFTKEGSAQEFEAATAAEAERIATDLTREIGCDWKYQSGCADLPHWFDEKDNLRIWDRIEIVDLGNGRGQLNCFAGKPRLSVDIMGEVEFLVAEFLWLARAWGRPGMTD